MPLPENDTRTFGQKAAGVLFNPSKFPEVDAIKQKFADIIDEANEFRKNNPGEAARYMSTAITFAEISQMEMVKAYTWEK